MHRVRKREEKYDIFLGSEATDMSEHRVLNIGDGEQFTPWHLKGSKCHNDFVPLV